MRRLISVLLMLPWLCFANPPDEDLSQRIIQSNQLILVTIPHENDIHGLLQRFTRQNSTQPWQHITKPVSVLIGKNGIAATTMAFSMASLNLPIKKEADNRTPIGIFQLGPIFGFEAKAQHVNGADYIQVDDNIICVDDPKSRYYNRIIDSSKIRNPDWDSKEEMRKIPNYQYGLVIQYNNQQRSENGSCIFMHLQSADKTGTAGCIALNEHDLKEILTWIDLTQNPIIAIFPELVYKNISNQWALPRCMRLICSTNLISTNRSLTG
ncbi:MAG: L,D-transpeptidase family protein [Proteobacteria bacterium]|nr:L,D-transpeptidase family protein [Pseudomonadota bacterium]